MPIQTTASSLETRIGRITLLCTQEAVCGLQLPNRAIPAPPPPPGSTAATAFQQIEEYLCGTRRQFSLPLQLPPQTDTARRILQAIAAIPYGSTLTYGKLGAPRAVGRVCATNPLPLLIPCHRVLPAASPPGQYQGGTELKRWLLMLESSLKGSAMCVPQLKNEHLPALPVSGSERKN